MTAIIAAGGRGLRFGSGVPKQLFAVGGRSLLERSVTLFVDHPEIDDIIVVLPVELAGSPPPYLVGLAKPVQIVAGGARRQDSVLNGFRAASASSDVIVVHDAARPFASPALVSRTIAAAAASGAAVAALAARDTVKFATPEGPADAGSADAANSPKGGHFVRTTLPRHAIFLAQTPQAFRWAVLKDALVLAETGVDVTDEASLAERVGHPVRVVEGEASNLKITTPEDLLVAEALANAERPAADRVPASRIGTGYDLHRLVEGRPLVIGGMTIPFERGALGHSDADVVCHAVTDAILGAACLGDIGRHFPDTDPRWKDASSLDLLAQAAAMIAARGFLVGNVDVSVVLERPKIKDYIEPMRRSVAAALGIEPDCVSIKGKTNEGVDAVGRGEAIAAHAVALLTLIPNP